MIVGDLTLGLERCQNGAVQLLCELNHRSHSVSRPISDDDNGPPCRVDSLHCSIERIRRWRNIAWPNAAFWSRRHDSLPGWQDLHFIREDQIHDVTLDHGVLQRECHQFGMLAAWQDGLVEPRHRVERRFQVNILESAGTENLGLHLSAQRDHWCAIHFGVPEAGE